MLEINKIYNEDCLEGMKKIDDKSVDAIITDLPYGQTSRNKWDSVIPFKPLWEQYERIIKDNGAIILFANGMFTADLMQSNRKLWKYNLIWEKTQPTGFLNAKKMPLRSHEDICIFYKKLPTYNPQMTDGYERKVSKAVHHVNAKKQLIMVKVNGKITIPPKDTQNQYGHLQKILKKQLFIIRRSQLP